MATAALNPSAREFVPGGFFAPVPTSQPPCLAWTGLNRLTGVCNTNGPCGPEASRHVADHSGSCLELEESDIFECGSTVSLSIGSRAITFAVGLAGASSAGVDVTPATEDTDSPRTSIASAGSNKSRPSIINPNNGTAATVMCDVPLASTISVARLLDPARALINGPSMDRQANFATDNGTVAAGLTLASGPPAAVPVVTAESLSVSAAHHLHKSNSTSTFTCILRTQLNTAGEPFALAASAVAASPGDAQTPSSPHTPALCKSKSSTSVTSLLHTQLKAHAAAATAQPPPDAGFTLSPMCTPGPIDADPVVNGSGLEATQGEPGNSCGVSLTVPVGSIVAEVASGQSMLSRVGPQDFEVLRVVGQGAFGKVFQVSYKGDGKVYAMKVMRKDRIVQKDHSEYVRSERDVLTAVTHPYIVAMRFSFQTPSKLYLVLDFVNGGHLFFNLYRQGVFSEDVARLYVAEIVCAISYLHGVGIVHRDLKPENVLLDCEGHVKITDFGLAKGNLHKDDDRTNSFIGTMEYMAPEIIQSRGHGKAVDWWSTGILLYEMLCGMPPFRAKSRQALQTQIVSAKLKFPKFVSSDAQSLLKGLLHREVAKRLGSGPQGSEAIKRHPFFKPINWAKLERREVESKFKPAVANSMDIANFDKIWTEQKAVDSPCGTPTTVAALAQHAHLFHGFTYVSPSYIVESVEAMRERAAAAALTKGPEAAPVEQDVQPGDGTR